ncbi:hypothetical protein ScPMuIL_016789 [Solemya velum]
MCMDICDNMAEASDCSSLSDDSFSSSHRVSSEAPSPGSTDGKTLSDINSLSPVDSSKLSCKPQYTAELEVLCRICGDRASGFHYGVHSCEGCKGFFRRTLKKQLVYKPCRLGSQCKIDAGTRNKCQYCRYQKCINAGMSQDAVRFGRMPKTEREKLIADKEELNNSCSKRILELRSLSDMIKSAFRDHFEGTNMIPRDAPRGSSPPRFKMEIEENCVINCLESHEFHSRGIFTCFQEMLVPLLEAAVKFAKKIPGFSGLVLSDQIVLLKQSSMSVAVTLMHTVVDRRIMYIQGSSQNFIIDRSQLWSLCSEARVLLEHIVVVCDRLNALQLQLVEIALYSAVLLVSECFDLKNPEKVEQVQGELLHALRLELKHNHPKDKLLFAKLLVLVTDLRQITEDFSKHLRLNIFDNSDNFTNIKPLVKEIFDIN